MSKYENDPQYEHKFFVVKDSIIQKELDFLQENGDEAYHNVFTFLQNVARKAGDKEYLVVNQDESYADEVWNLIRNNEKPQIIAFTGRAGSGKDYQCNLLVEQGFTKMAFADALRDIAFTILGIEDRSPEHYDLLKKNNCIQVTELKENIKCGVFSDIQSTEIHSLNFREFLELLGTQGIRKYCPDFWIEALINTIRNSNVKKICISDLRFDNEYIKLQQFAEDNGYEFKCIFCNYRSDRYQDSNTHESAMFSNYLATHG